MTAMTADTDHPDIKKYLAVPNDRSHQRYNNWRDGVKKEINKIYQQDTRRAFRACLNHLEIYHNALVLNLDCRTQDAIDYIEKELLRLRPESLDENGRTLEELYKVYKRRLMDAGAEELNPKLRELAEVLRRGMIQSDSRTIIFVRTRAMTVALTNWMKSDASLVTLNPNYLTGASAKAGSGGLTQTQQEDLLKAFKQGEHKVVIATSVGEEGLDVQKCNLVIRYEYVTNEIAMVQARGRGRAEGAKYILITDREANKERINQIREKMMQTTLLKLTNKPTFAADVLRTQKEGRVQRKLKAKEKKRKAKMNQEKPQVEFSVYCLNCDAFACTSSDIRKVQNAHHVVISNDLDERVNFVQEPTPAEYGGGEYPFTDLGRISCKNPECNLDWGVKMLYQGMPMPVIKISSFILEDTNGNRNTFKKWKMVQVPEITTEDWERYIADMDSEED